MKIWQLTVANTKPHSQWILITLVVLSLVATPFEMAMAQSADPRLNPEPLALTASASAAMAQATAQIGTRPFPGPVNLPQKITAAPHKNKKWKVVLMIAVAGAGAAVAVLAGGSEPPPHSEPLLIEVLPLTIGQPE